MDLNEAIVMQWLTRRANVFVSAQYSIDDDWSRPDFVALYFGERVYAVVEVSAIANISCLAQKVRERKTQWIDRLTQQLMSNGIIDYSWSSRVEVFIRQDTKGRFDKEVGVHDDVRVYTLEGIGYPWEPHWYS